MSAQVITALRSRAGELLRHADGLGNNSAETAERERWLAAELLALAEAAEKPDLAG